MSERLTQITLVDKNLLELLPGEINCYTKRRNWFIGCPGCKGHRNLQAHMVTENDGSITVSPSILCGCGAHYFIENNQIRWV